MKYTLDAWQAGPAVAAAAYRGLAARRLAPAFFLLLPALPLLPEAPARPFHSGVRPARISALQDAATGGERLVTCVGG
jgi:hypothetical protein